MSVRELFLLPAAGEINWSLRIYQVLPKNKTFQHIFIKSCFWLQTGGYKNKPSFIKLLLNVFISLK